MDALTTISTRRTPQREQADPRQIANAAGGYGFAIGDEARVHRFLTLGTDGGTYYTSERQHTKASAEVVLRVARERGAWLVERIVEVSVGGRAPRQNPAIFALAVVAGLGDDEARRAALDALPAVCRTGTHLFLFATYVEQFRGWGRGLRRAVGRWYLDRDVDAVAYQATKYRQREGWTHRDLLRLAHPETDEELRRGLFDWITGRGPVGEYLDNVPGIVNAYAQAQRTTDVGVWTRLVEDHPLSWEMLPDQALTQPAVWRALIARGMPQTALVRQLPRLTRLGVLDGDTLRTVCAQLADPEALRRARVHPVSLLIALRTYAAGRSARGEATWTPLARVIDALDAAFYASWGTVEPAGKRTLVALDVSGSMTQAVSGLPLSCREASAALALVTLATEPESECVGFASAATPSRIRHGGGNLAFRGITGLALSPRQRLDDAVRSVSDLPFGGTDCALPMMAALERGASFDTFVIVTDSETWAGPIHPHQALVRYREQTGIDARLVVVGMTATDVSIADPTDPGTLDVAGFDSAAPSLISAFSRGDL
jgi:60 kDa SS-A/Ro ribonucleoprotein